MDAAFSQFNLQPAYGPGKMAVTWRVDPKYKDGLIFVFRSINGGLPPWTLQNAGEVGIPAIAGYFVDDISTAKHSMLSQLHYRLALRMPNGDVHDSPVVNPFGRLTPHEHKIVVDLMWQELRFLRAGNGVPIYVYAPKLSGMPSAGFDPVSKQMHSSGDDSYGQAYIGGFSTPALTWMHRYGSLVTRQGPAGDGFGNTVGQASQARLLAFPRPAPGYLIVQPDADARYKIGDPIVPMMFRGIIPIGYEVQLLPLPRTDEAYGLPVPAIPDEMYATAS